MVRGSKYSCFDLKYYAIQHQGRLVYCYACLYNYILQYLLTQFFLYCHDSDERLCGPQFLECAGANRRQSGIVSAIGRDAEHEQCHSVDIDWVGTL
jgi:hypothetical protein